MADSLTGNGQKNGTRSANKVINASVNQKRIGQSVPVATPNPAANKKIGKPLVMPKKG